MKRQIAAVILALLGTGLIGFGIMIEFDIHDQLEGGRMAGFRRFIVRRWPEKLQELHYYRLTATVCVIAGPLMVGAAYLIGVRNGGKGRAGRNL
jgi:hypothetical protein